jgi:hypothetical protein
MRDGPFYGGSPRICRLPYLDLSSIRRKGYDKGGCKRFLRDFRYAYFGDGKRLTKRRCEEFFSDDKNFIRQPERRLRQMRVVQHQREL